MNSISVPFLPVGLWLLATAGCIIIMLVIFAMYWTHRRRFQSALGDSLDVATLAARKEQLQADVQELRNWITDQKDEMARLQSEREEQERLRGELSRLQSECATAEQQITDLRKEAGGFEAQRHSISQTIERLGKEADELHRRIEELEKKRDELASIEGRIKEAHANLDKAMDDKVEAQRERDDVIRKVVDKRIELDALHRECDGLDRSRQGFEKDAEKARVEAQEAEKQATQLRQEAEEASRLLDDVSRQLQEQRNETGRAEEQRQSLNRQNQRLETEKIRMEEAIADAKKKLIESERSVQNWTDQARKAEANHREKASLLERVENRLGDLEKKEKRLGNEVAALERERDSLIKEIEGQQGGGPSSEEPYADLLKVLPDCLIKDHFPAGKKPDTNEEATLGRVIDGLKANGYHFHERVVKAFHTSLKCHDINPLTVLAGVSGTGKTLLPMAYARHMGMHSLVMAVQPRWDSPNDMFGFYNHLEKSYKATDLARALLRMDPYNTPRGLEPSQKRTDRVLLVLLDEMNLARTEYYFSEFLSKLELRREINDPSNATARMHAEVVLDTGPGRDDIRFWVDRNVLFVGTMNEDESTQTLSDKVLDRANVLRFGRPKELPDVKDAQAKAPTGGHLSRELWNKWCRPPENRPGMDMVQKWISELNEALNRIGRPFGYRVQKGILRYVANYPDGGYQDAWRLAFADQIEQKILPKLRGIDPNDGTANTTLDEIERVINDTGDKELMQAISSARQDTGSGLFLWRGVTR